MKSNIEQFKNGIFALHTRRFGKIAELMIQKIYQMLNSDNLAYDAISSKKEKIEIKFSRALNKENQESITFNNVIEQCYNANLLNRQINSYDSNFLFDCNIQQIKPKEFDILYFGIFFNDIIQIFQISSEEILSLPGYSNHQHRGNVGEGQFHINNSNIEYFKNNYLIKTLTYLELFNLFNKGEKL